MIYTILFLSEICFCSQFDRDCVEHFLFVLWDTPRRKCLKLGGVPFIQGLSLKDEAERSERYDQMPRGTDATARAHESSLLTARFRGLYRIYRGGQ